VSGLNGILESMHKHTVHIYRLYTDIYDLIRLKGSTTHYERKIWFKKYTQREYKLFDKRPNNIQIKIWGRYFISWEGNTIIVHGII